MIIARDVELVTTVFVEIEEDGGVLEARGVGRDELFRPRSVVARPEKPQAFLVRGGDRIKVTKRGPGDMRGNGDLDDCGLVGRSLER